MTDNPKTNKPLSERGFTEKPKTNEEIRKYWEEVYWANAYFKGTKTEIEYFIRKVIEDTDKQARASERVKHSAILKLAAEYFHDKTLDEKSLVNFIKGMQEGVRREERAKADILKNGLYTIAHMTTIASISGTAKLALADYQKAIEG